MKYLALILMLITAQAMAKPKTLTIWTSNENVRDAIMQQTKAFEKDYGAKVEVNVLNKNVTTQFKTAALTGKGPDILTWAHDVVGELAESGLIEPITLSPTLKKNLLEVAVQAYTYKGRVYGYPYDLEAIAMIYNKDLLPKLPATMEELIAKAKEMTKGDQYGFLYDFANLFFSFPFITAGGGYIFKDTGRGVNIHDIGVATEGAIEGVELLSKLAHEGIIPSSTDRNIAFSKMKEGKLAVTIDGPWALGDLRRSKINYEIASFPTLGGKQPRPFVGTHGFIVRRSSRNKELAKEFIENYLMTKEGIMTLYKKDPRGPSRYDVLTELSKTDKDLVAFMKNAEVGIPMPNVPEMGAVWGAMGSAIRLSINGQSTPEKSLKEAKMQIESSIKK